jgi:hypothetical protein
LYFAQITQIEGASRSHAGPVSLRRASPQQKITESRLLEIFLEKDLDSDPLLCGHRLP